MSSRANPPPTAPTTTKSISDFLSTIQAMIREDTTSTVGDLERLEAVNGQVRDRYKELADGAGRKLEEEGGRLGGVYADIEGYMKQIDSMEDKVSNLELLVEELDLFADDLVMADALAGTEVAPRYTDEPVAVRRR